MDVRASPAEKVYQHHTNRWRRERFAAFPFRPGHSLPPAVVSSNGIVKNYLQAFFETPAEAAQEWRVVHGRSGHSVLDSVIPTITSLPAYHRPQLVSLGSGECYDCDGTGWLLYVPVDLWQGQLVLAERPCDGCGGTGNWRQAEIRSGYPEHYFHRIPPGFRGPGPGSPVPNTGPFEEHLRQRLPPVKPVRRRRGAPGLFRTVVGLLIFWALITPVAQPFWWVTHNSNATILLAMIATAGITAVITRVVFGPLRDNQILGPLWVLITPIYLLFAFVVALSMPFNLKFLDDLAVSVLEAAMSARIKLSEIPLGR